MNKQNGGPFRPGLLVSVRNAEEALAALAGGADVIDVKEPDRGPLGAADAATIEAVVRTVQGRAPVTAAMGELTNMLDARLEPVPAGVSLFKIGLAGCRALPDWRAPWRSAMQVASRRDPQSRVPRSGGINPPARGVAVAYADWSAAGAPPANDVLHAAIEVGCPALLIDTWDKSAGSLFDHWPREQLGDYLQWARAKGLLVVLAGSLANENFTAAAGLFPDLVAVRAAACEGGRRGPVSALRVRALQALLASAGPPDAGVFERPKFFLDNASELRILETT
jgi:uncharacterized protein (UPF0264 family)